MAFSRVVEVKGKLLCSLYFLISLMAFSFIVTTMGHDHLHHHDVVSSSTEMMNSSLVGHYILFLSVVISTAYFLQHHQRAFHALVMHKKSKWMVVMLVSGLCDKLGKKMMMMITETTENKQQLMGITYQLICYSTVLLMMLIALFWENDSTGFTVGISIGFFFIFMENVLGGWGISSYQTLLAAVVFGVSILALVTEAPDELADAKDE